MNAGREFELPLVVTSLDSITEGWLDVRFR
jgi:hypothetical protein